MLRSSALCRLSYIIVGNTNVIEFASVMGCIALLALALAFNSLTDDNDLLQSVVFLIDLI